MQEQQEAGKRVSITHVVGKGIALAIRKAPSMNGYLLWDRYLGTPHAHAHSIRLCCRDSLT